MALSTETIITLIGVLVNLPPVLLILWNIIKWKRRGRTGADSAGVCLHFLPYLPICFVFLSPILRLNVPMYAWSISTDRLELVEEARAERQRRLVLRRRRNTVITLVLDSRR